MGSRLQQAACIAFRFEDGEPECLLITSRDTGRWVLPKGSIEEDESARDCAKREAYEEAGVRGKLSSTKVGCYTYRKTERKGGGHCMVKVFAMEVSELSKSWPEKADRKRKWMTFEEASDSVAEPDLQDLLEKFGRQLAKSVKKAA
ncbi:MAG: NUDIX hydrolase [Magnetovibrionaceae bacterium]